MKVKAYWKSISPFNPDVNSMGYAKTVDVPDGTDLKVLEEYAKQDSEKGYKFDRLEVLDAEPKTD